MTTHFIGRWLIPLGAFLGFLGGLLLLVGKVPLLGKLPGDIHIHRKNFEFVFPVTTCLIASLVFPAVLSFLTRK